MFCLKVSESKWMVLPWVFFSLESESMSDKEKYCSLTISGLIDVWCWRENSFLIVRFGSGRRGLIPWALAFSLKPQAASSSFRWASTEQTASHLGSPLPFSSEIFASHPSVMDSPARGSNFCMLCHFDQLNFKGWFLQKMLKAASSWVTS